MFDFLIAVFGMFLEMSPVMLMALVSLGAFFVVGMALLVLLTRERKG